MCRFSVLAALALVACATSGGGRVPLPAAAPSLPPMPLAEGALRPRVQYPAANALITSLDSNFIFGEVGNGRATLSINGVSVAVHPNGSFLAYLPLPPREEPQYELLAVLGTDTARLVHPVRLLPERVDFSREGPRIVDSASVSPPPRGLVTLRADEWVRVSVRAPANVTAWVRWDSAGRQMLVNDAASPAATLAPRPDAADSIDVRYLGDSETWATDLQARSLTSGATLFVARGADTVRLALTPVSLADSGTRSWAMLGAEAIAASDTDRVVHGRPVPGDTYKWFILPGTQLEITGRSGDYVRLRLDTALEVWVLATDVRPLPAGWPAPRRIAANARLVPGGAWTDFSIPVGERPAYGIEEGTRSITLTLYGTQGTTDITRFAANDSLVRMVTWEQETSDRVRYTLHLAAKPFGYLVFYESGRFVLRIRRPPLVDRGRPLRGLTIAVDPGHPPIGATGPTGLYEAVPVLAIGQRVRRLLESRGARVVMTRTTDSAVALGDRPVMARRANAHALVSIHLNALPDGVNPFTAHGTETYFFHPHAEPLARAVQRGMVARMGLRDIGVYSRSLALARPTWMPSILCEGAFIMIPEQEAALRTAEFQEAYALGIADGLEAFFRSLAEPR